MNRLFHELRRRNVFRVAAAYVVVGWLLVQIVTSIEGPLNLPSWTDTFVIVLLGVGLPVALLLAWAFEMTPDGMKLTAAAPETTSIAATTGRKLDYVVVAALAAVVVMIAWQQMTGPRAAPPQAAPTQVAGAQVAGTPNAASIAVLPFADLSTDGDQAYFADGIAEEILNVLARIEALDVTSRTSAFAFRSQGQLGIRDIAAALGVRHVLEGSVRTSGETIRITAQLIDADTDQHIWSQTYDRDLSAENIFAIQDDIAGAITAELARRLGVEIDAAPAASGGTREIDAYETFLRGRELFINRNFDALPNSVAALEQAVAADSEFGRAWGWLAMAYAVSPAWGFSDRDYIALAEQAAERALALDPNNVSALTALGVVAQQPPEPDFEAVIDYFERAIEADPQATTAHVWLGQVWRDLGFFDRAEAAVMRCLDIDPNYPVCLFTYAELALLTGRFDLAKERLLDVLATNHAESYPQFLGAAAALGEDALLTMMLREMADLIAPDSRWIVTDLRRALSDEVYDRQAALERFEARIRATGAAGVDDPYFVTGYALAFGAFDHVPEETGAAAWWWFPGYPGLEASDARRRAITDENLPAYWRKHGFPPRCRPVGDDDFACD